MQNEEFRKLLGAEPAKAITFLYENYYHRLILISLKLTGDPKTAEDVVQETILHVWENHKKLSEYHESSIEFYLVRVVRNKSISSFKRAINYALEKLQLLKDSLSNTESSVEMKLIEVERNQELHEIIATLPRRERECLSMKHFDGLTTRQIAIQLNVTLKAVERSLTSANKRLRKIYLEKNQKTII